MPCNDVHEGAKSAVVTTDQAQDHHQDHKDICSPFCSCACCQISIALSSFISTIIPVSPFTANFSFYTEKFFSSASAAIWQPPKLG
jgi:hypothetical protein